MLAGMILAIRISRATKTIVPRPIERVKLATTGTRYTATREERGERSKESVADWNAFHNGTERLSGRAGQRVRADTLCAKMKRCNAL